MKKNVLKLLCFAAFFSIFCFKPTNVFASPEDDISNLNSQISQLEEKLSDLQKTIDQKEEDLNSTNQEIQKRDKIIENVDSKIQENTSKGNEDIEELAEFLSTKIIENETKNLLTGSNDVFKVNTHPVSFSLLEKEDCNIIQSDVENTTLEATKQDLKDENAALENEASQKTTKRDELLSEQSKIKNNINDLQNQIAIIQKNQKDQETANRIYNKYGIKVPTKNVDLVATSLQYLGIDYVWGGETPSGFDCSGLVKYVYAQYGVYLPRTTYYQINCGTEVKNRNDLQPGDLIFPHDGHVQMYIGNGRVIHAPHTGDVVRIAPLGSYISARRIIN